LTTGLLLVSKLTQAPVAGPLVSGCWSRDCGPLRSTGPGPVVLAGCSVALEAAAGLVLGAVVRVRPEPGVAAVGIFGVLIGPLVVAWLLSALMPLGVQVPDEVKARLNLAAK
jgi:hypothetical protein